MFSGSLQACASIIKGENGEDRKKRE